MIRIRTLSLLSVVICVMGLFAASVGAAAEPDYGISIDGVSANCTSKEVVVTYGFDNFSGGEGTNEVVTITVKTSDGTTVDSTSEATVVHFEPSEPYEITLLLTATLKPGITYTVILQLKNGEEDDDAFVACVV